MPREPPPHRWYPRDSKKAGKDSGSDGAGSTPSDDGRTARQGHDNGSHRQGATSDPPDTKADNGGDRPSHSDRDRTDSRDQSTREQVADGRGASEAEPRTKGTQPSGGRGQWETVNEAMSERAAKYQEQVTGRPVTDSYVVDGPTGKVRFDGYADGQYQEAKGPGYASFVSTKTNEFYPWFDGAESLVAQAERQLQAADGTPVVWTFAEHRAADAFEQRLAEEGITGLIVKVDPPTGG